MKLRILFALTGLVLGTCLAFAQPPFCGQACPVSTRGERLAKKAVVPTTVVNSRRLRLNYSIKDIGPSGVSAVELWATRDGKSWARYSNEPPPEGPLVVQVADEGKYGFTVVVRNGVGERSPAPVAGDTPQMWVVVDETKPEVRVHDAKAGCGADKGTLVVHWSASDERLALRPVTVSIAAKKSGPWLAVATAVENTGKHTVALPKDHPYEFFVKVEAVDKAGNLGCDTLLTPIKIDHCRPKGTITGVDTETKTALVPTSIPAPVENAKPVALPVLSGFLR